MRLYLLSQSSSLSRNIVKFSRRLNIKVVTRQISSLDRAIVITDGTPDDIVLSILAYRMNGKITVGILKSEAVKRFGAFRLLKIDPTLSKHIKKILFVLDQENQSLDMVVNKINNKISQLGIKIKELKNYKIRRVYVYNCEIGDWSFELIVTINGLDSVPTKFHTIEDHLVKFMDVEVTKGMTSKAVWRKTKNQLDIFQKILSFKGKLEEYFPQQIIGLKCLEE